VKGSAGNVPIDLDHHAPKLWVILLPGLTHTL